MTDTTTAAPQHSGLSRLYTGTGGFDIVGRRKFYYLLTGGIVLVALLSMLIRGFSWGIDFEGGTRIQMPAVEGVTVEQVETVYSDTLGTEPVAVQTVGSGSGATIQIRSEALDLTQVNAVQSALFEEFQPTDSDGVPSRNSISVADVSETWGGQITQKALIALVVFLVIVSIYIAARYERDMAIAAIVALFFDMIVTAGIYSLVGFEVSPATVIGLLTILGFSLYDSVVVFDKVEENTRGILHLHRRTYAEQANLAVNQTLMRSINTTISSTTRPSSMCRPSTPRVAAHTRKVLAKREAAAVRASAGTTASDADPVFVAEHPGGTAPRRAPAAQPQRSPRPGTRPTGKRAKRRP